MVVVVVVAAAGMNEMVKTSNIPDFCKASFHRSSVRSGMTTPTISYHSIVLSIPMVPSMQ
jgi:hypothetical protein